MKYDSDIHGRRSIRLRGYDYSLEGAYFVTICANHRECLFGDVENAEMRLNEVGRIIADEWVNTAFLRSNIDLDEFVVMPNHIHCIVAITESRGRGVLRRRGVLQYAPTGIGNDDAKMLQSPSQTIGAVVRGFKSAATKQVNEFRLTPGMKLWQRNYWERVIRNQPELDKIREYIVNNPRQWELDSLFPGKKTN